jgi:hypothetical protein
MLLFLFLEICPDLPHIFGSYMPGDKGKRVAGMTSLIKIR